MSTIHTALAAVAVLLGAIAPGRAAEPVSLDDAFARAIATHPDLEVLHFTEAGLAAAAAYLMGGDAEAQANAMQTVIGTFAGMLCDGAKGSCAFKVATVVGAAVDIAALAVQGAFVAAGDGIVGATVDRSFANLARLNDPGMRGTEQAVLDIIAACGAA